MFVMLFGGERQCVVFVWVFVCKWLIMLLDELFVVFDFVFWYQMGEFFVVLYCDEGFIVLMIMYDFDEVVWFVDWFVFIDGGCVVCQGMIVDFYDVGGC